jgi:hypothetical protein
MKKLCMVCQKPYNAGFERSSSAKTCCQTCEDIFRKANGRLNSKRFQSSERGKMLIKAYWSTPEGIAQKKAKDRRYYRSKPEVRERIKARAKLHSQLPESKKRLKIYCKTEKYKARCKELNQTEKYKTTARAYRNRPEWKDKNYAKYA